MSFLWGAIAGTVSPIPYFYSVFFITVLVHRCGRDFERYVEFMNPWPWSNHRLSQVLAKIRQGLGSVL